jgi:hypothetical protein
VHRSIYHLKEADPHAGAIPRLAGQAKASLVAVEFDEFGGGHADRMHAQLFADLMDAAGLHPGYLHYLDSVPAPAIAIVNLMSLFGLHRALRGALIGHFAAAEITTAPSAYRMSQALHRLEADAVHEHRAGVGDAARRRDPPREIPEQPPSPPHDRKRAS